MMLKTRNVHTCPHPLNCFQRVDGEGPCEGWNEAVNMMGFRSLPAEVTSAMPTDAEERKRRPVVSGVLDYFPAAILAVAEVSLVGNEQHGLGPPLRWDREKSRDHADALGRHLMLRGTRDTDRMRHSAKVAWRALAMLQEEIESETTGGIVTAL